MKIKQKSKIKRRYGERKWKAKEDRPPACQLPKQILRPEA